MTRKITTFIFLCLCTIYSVCAQTFNYQAVVRDASNAPVANQSIGVLVRIIEGSPTGSVVYNEAHTVTSNDFGIITLPVGGGTSGANFSAIDWSQQNQWIDIQVDITGGTTYVQLGTSKLQFVPYAMYALNSNNATNAGPFNYTNNVVSNSNGSIISDDFVFGSSQLDVNGAFSPALNNRLFFDKSKAAFRAGYTSGDQWDEAKIGDYSVGLGQGGTASGTNSFAMGRNANASGNEAFAFGFNAGGFADYAKGIGLNARAFGVGATALGTHLQANSYGEVQLGMYSVFTSGDANNWVATDRLFVIGNGQDDINNALDSDALVMLKNGNTTLHGTFTVDADNVGGSAGYTLPGQDGTTNQVLSTDGSGNVAWVNSSSALPNGGTNGNVLQTDGSGNYSWTSNDILPAGGTNEFVLQTDGAGNYTWVTKDDADADATNEIELPTGGTNGQVLATDGSGVYTWVDQPTVLGAVFSTVSNVTSNAPGDTTVDDFVFGSTQIDDIPGIPDNNRMVFDKSKAGAFRAGSAFNTPYFNQDQLGAGSVGFGVNNQATGIYAATMGNFNDSSGYASFTTGDFNTASGGRSFSAGSNNTSSGDNAFTFGLALTSEALVQTTLGLNNTAVSGTAGSFVATDRLLVVGNGVDGANKSDALVMLKNGNTTLNGELTIDGDNQGMGASYTFPAQDGTANQVMSTDGSGAVSWIDAPSGGGSGTFSTTANVTSNANGTVATDDFVFGSTQLANDTGTTNDDNRIFFDKSKAAFRAGSVTGNEWDDANVGMHSIGLGQGAEPRGSNAIAIGTSVEALGDGSIGLGNQTSSIGTNSIVIGNTSVALSRDQITLGTWNERDLTGNPTSWVTTDRLLVVGNGTGSMALSNALVMLKNGNTTLNGQLTIDGDNAGAGTSYTLPAQDGTANQVMSTDGSGAVSWIDAPSGGTTLPAGGSNGQVLSTDGSGVYSWVTDAVNDADADATNEIELPVGGSNGQVLATDGSGVYSWVDQTAMSSVTFATTANVTSNANGTIATDDFVFGSTQLANVTGTTNDDSRMFFDKSKSAFRAGYAFDDKWDDSNIGVNSIALGLNSGATELNTVAIGNSVNANRLGAVAIGYDSGVAGEYGISLGSGNISFAKNEVVIGSYASFDVSASTNTWVPTERLFVIGNGTSLGSRSSALVMLKNGNTTLNGSLTIDGDNAGAGTPYTLPAQDGTANQVMSTNGSGAVSWVTAPADGDGDSTNEIELPVGGSNGQVLQTDGSGGYSWTNNTVAPGVYTAATLNSAGGWQYYNTAFGVTNFQDPRYRKVDNVVTLEGLCRKSSAITNGDVVMTLPVGFRPLKTRIFSVETENGTARVDVNPNGTVLVATGFNVTQNWVSLDGLTFSVD